eukprot:3009826-Rhodomonas_salina.3
MVVLWACPVVRQYHNHHSLPPSHHSTPKQYADSGRFVPGKITDFANQIVFLPVPLPVAVPALSARIARVRGEQPYCHTVSCYVCPVLPYRMLLCLSSTAIAYRGRCPVLP